ncbi:MAG TPA: NAD(+)/NADH kinase [Gaiellaceae bacterium]|jgi:NAD+ kinase|nr:NAD(+)/NADH kinase [Gaiellaceae bacterium]
MQPIRRAAVVTHGVTANVDEAAARLRVAADAAGVELLDEHESGAEIAVCLGGDGTILRALKRFLESGVPVIGANFGRVGFLAAIPGNELETGIARVFAGEYAVQSLPTLEVEVAGGLHVAVNDAVVVSGSPGRIIELDYSLSGEDLGTQACDGLLCATPPGSTAYNLSNGGPVLVWGLEAAVITFVAPHTLHARPLVVGPGFELEVVNRTPDVEAVVLVDGRPIGSLERGAPVRVRLGESRTLLATLPEQTFFGRYAEVFGID